MSLTCHQVGDPRAQPVGGKQGGPVHKWRRMAVLKKAPTCTGAPHAQTNLTPCSCFRSCFHCHHLPKCSSKSPCPAGAFVRGPRVHGWGHVGARTCQYSHRTWSVFLNRNHSLGRTPYPAPVLARPCVLQCICRVLRARRKGKDWGRGDGQDREAPARWKPPVVGVDS